MIDKAGLVRVYAPLYNPATLMQTLALAKVVEGCHDSATRGVAGNYRENYDDYLWSILGPLSEFITRLPMTTISTEEASLEREIWPDDLIVRNVDSTIATTLFRDMGNLTGGLIKYLVEREQKVRADGPLESAGVGGTKIYHVDSWAVPGAKLLDERAQQFFRRSTGNATSVVDLSWANVYRAGDYILPHVHRRSTGSVVFVLTLGNQHDTDSAQGRFGITDARLPLCWHEDQVNQFAPCFPPLQAGSMICFPSSVLHFVTPYRGESKPRITISWNINAQLVAGRPGDEDATITTHPG